MTAGASQALDLICTLYTQPGDVVFVEEPSYFLALRIFADHRLRVVGVPTDAEGLRIDALEELLRQQRPAFLYTIPTHQNPAGFTLPLARRRRLVELAQQHGFLVVADEVYHLLSYGAPPPPPLASWAATGAVLALGSFSKILAPGLRLGWLQAAPEHIHRLVTSGLLDSGGGLNPFTSGLVRVALERGWQEEHLGRLRRRLPQADRRHGRCAARLPWATRPAGAPRTAATSSGSPSPTGRMRARFPNWRRRTKSAFGRVRAFPVQAGCGAACG